MTRFHVGAHIGCKSRKTTFRVFGIFTPLLRRLRLSRTSKTIDIEEIYRFMSKNIHFMPCGSVFGRFSVLCRVVENLSKFSRKSIEHLSKIYRKSIENLSNIYRISSEKLSIGGLLWVTLGLLWGHFGVKFGSSGRLWRLMCAISTSKSLRWHM